MDPSFPSDALRNFVEYPKQYLQHIEPINMEKMRITELMFELLIEVRKVVLKTYIASIKDSMVSNRENNDESFITQMNSNSVYLTDITGTITMKTIIYYKSLPSVFRYDIPSTTSYIVKLILQTASENICVYMDGQQSNIVINDEVEFSDIQITRSNSQLSAGFIQITKYDVLKRKMPTERIVHQMTDTDLYKSTYSLVWDVRFKPAETYFISYCIPCWLIRLKVSPDCENNIDAKIIMSMTDGSCSFIGIAYDYNVASILGVNQREWTFIKNKIQQERTRIEIISNDYDSSEPLTVLFMKLFKKARVLKYRKFQFKILSVGNPEIGDPERRRVQYKAAIDEERKVWAKLTTELNNSVVCKIITVEQER